MSFVTYNSDVVSFPESVSCLGTTMKICIADSWKEQKAKSKNKSNCNESELTYHGHPEEKLNNRTTLTLYYYFFLLCIFRASRQNYFVTLPSSALYQRVS